MNTPIKFWLWSRPKNRFRHWIIQGQLWRTIRWKIHWALCDLDWWLMDLDWGGIVFFMRGFNILCALWMAACFCRDVEPVSLVFMCFNVHAFVKD